MTTDRQAKYRTKQRKQLLDLKSLRDQAQGVTEPELPEVPDQWFIVTLQNGEFAPFTLHMNDLELSRLYMNLALTHYKKPNAKHGLYAYAKRNNSDVEEAGSMVLPYEALRIISTALIEFTPSSHYYTHQGLVELLNSQGSAKCTQ